MTDQKEKMDAHTSFVFQKQSGMERHRENIWEQLYYLNTHTHTQFLYLSTPPPKPHIPRWEKPSRRYNMISMVNTMWTDFQVKYWRAEHQSAWSLRAQGLALCFHRGPVRGQRVIRRTWLHGGHEPTGPAGHRNPLLSNLLLQSGIIPGPLSISAITDTGPINPV